MKRWKWGISLAVAIVVAVLSVPAQAGPPVDNPSSLNLTELLNRVAVLEGMVVTLQMRIAALEAAGIPDLKDYVSVDRDTNTVLVSGANLQIVNGAGSTDTLNGLGNLIVGYNEPRSMPLEYAICSDGQFDNQADCENNDLLWAVDHKSGSHNIVGGDQNAYSSYGGLIVGYKNAVNGDYASVSGGGGNTASGYYSSVSGGQLNTASNTGDSVSGGNVNRASGGFSSVSGGSGNTASGPSSSVSGGQDNNTSDWCSSVSGGYGNIASGYISSVTGGRSNAASGIESSVSGGYNRSVTDSFDWAAGGLFQDN